MIRATNHPLCRSGQLEIVPCSRRRLLLLIRTLDGVAAHLYAPWKGIGRQPARPNRLLLESIAPRSACSTSVSPSSPDGRPVLYVQV